jgi:hypothetical protein
MKCCRMCRVNFRTSSAEQCARNQNVKDMLADLQEFVSQTQYQAKFPKVTPVKQGAPPSRSTAPALPPTSSTESKIARRKPYRNEAWLVIPIAILALAVFGVFFFGALPESRNRARSGGQVTKPGNSAVPESERGFNAGLLGIFSSTRKSKSIVRR